MKRFVLSIIVILSLGCAACAKPSFEKKTVNLSIQDDPSSLDPRKGGDRRSQVVLRAMYEGLTRLNNEGVPELAIADKVLLSKNRRQYIFHLKDTFWSNGLPVTAHDFEYAWKGALEKNFSSSFYHAFFVIKNARKARMGDCSLDEVGVRSIDDKTLEVTLENPTPYFLELTANPIFSPLCKKFIEQTPSWPKTEPDIYVSNGPFLLKEQVLKSHLSLKKNPTYWNKDSIRTKTIHFSIVKDASTAYNLFCNKELDWYGDPCCIISVDILQNMQAPLVRKQAGGLFWLVVNTKKPYLSSPKIRKALASAINREEIVSFLQCGEMPAFSILTPSMSMLDTPPFSDHDTVAAVRLFEEGLQEMGLTRETFPCITITHWNEPATKGIVELLQQQIQNALGIKIELNCFNWMPFRHRIHTGELDIATTAWYPWVQDPMFNLSYLKFTNNGINGTGWQNAEYIKELDMADTCININARRAHLKRAEEIAADHLPIIPLFSLCHRYAKSEGLQGEIVSPVGVFDCTRLERKEGSSP